MSNLLMWKVALCLVWPALCAAEKSEPLSQLKFKAGDTILTPFINSGMGNLPPYHSMFAIDEKRILDIGAASVCGSCAAFWEVKMKTIVKFFSGPEPIGVVVPPETKICEAKGPLCCVQPGKVIRPIGQAGITLAKRLNGLDNMPYELTRCNCRHWCDYLTYGTTFGSWLTPGYWPISDQCPLHLTLTDKSATDDPNFVLMDKLGKTYAINPVSEIHEYKQENETRTE